MKLLIVTSQVTYVPGNYHKLFRELLEFCQKTPQLEVAGLVSLKTLDTQLLKTMVGLPFLGVRQLTKSLAVNSLELPLRKRDQLTQKYGVPHLSWDTINDSSVVQWIKENKVDLILNIRTRCIYKPEVLKAPTLGCLNIHHGLLPEYRGTFCDLYALYEGRQAGFSLHKMEKRVDAGTIYRVIPVGQDELNYMEYLKKAENSEIEVLKEFLLEVLAHNGLPDGLPNQAEKKTYTKNPSRDLIKKFKQKGLVL